MAWRTCALERSPRARRVGVASTSEKSFTGAARAGEASESRARGARGSVAAPRRARVTVVGGCCSGMGVTPSARAVARVMRRSVIGVAMG